MWVYDFHSNASFYSFPPFPESYSVKLIWMMRAGVVRVSISSSIFIQTLMMWAAASGRNLYSSLIQEQYRRSDFHGDSSIKSKQWVTRVEQ